MNIYIYIYMYVYINTYMHIFLHIDNIHFQYLEAAGSQVSLNPT